MFRAFLVLFQTSALLPSDPFLGQKTLHSFSKKTWSESSSFSGKIGINKTGGELLTKLPTATGICAS